MKHQTIQSKEKSENAFERNDTINQKDIDVLS
jgi:hypothetical protein